MNYENLRKQYDEFIYEAFSAEDLGSFFRVSYSFSIPKLADFKPTWEFPKPDNAVLDSTLKAMFFSLGMVELISYWKCCCPEKVTVKCGFLNERQCQWWKKLYFNGLGEFFYINGIQADSDSFMQITSSGSPFGRSPKKPLSGYLVPIGGGKDSAVTLELLKTLTNDISCYIINPGKAAEDTCLRSGICTEALSVHRTTRRLDRRIIELNAQGFLNGHTPFSAVVAFSALITSYLYGKKYIALSNEASANEATVFSGANHQYSKSYEFEKDFRQYEKAYINSGISYFSLLRPLSEYQIAKLFASYPQYHDVFRSCNAGSKEDKWCGKCAKCLFVAIILSPFLPSETINAIFGTDILNDLSLIPLINQLTGINEEKPFECVGSRDEVVFAIHKAAAKKGQLPALFSYYLKHPSAAEARMDYDRFFNTENFAELRALCAVAAEALEFDDYIKSVLSGKRVAILGYGREGCSTAGLLCRLGIPYSVIDRNEASAPGIYGEGYLDALNYFDVVIKSPGVVLDRPVCEYKCCLTSQTELFLIKYRKQTIGITGTKGKSTTSALISNALQCCGVDSLLAGNIGVPPFDSVKAINTSTVCVLELSSHQLEYISVSPHIAVYLNLQEEHLDHYGSFEKYRLAKENIYKYQMQGDTLICLSSLKPDSTAACVITVDFMHGDMVIGQDSISYRGITTKIKPEQAKLAGRHSLYDIGAALCAVYEYTGVDGFVSSLPEFIPLKHRLENIGTYNGVTYYDDSISTIGDTAINALKALPDTATILIGGMERGISYDDLIKYLSASAVRNIILMEATGKRIYNEALSFSTESFKDRLYIAEGLTEAVRIAKKVTNPGEICLLSPAAASYGSFKNFEERGDIFASLVREA